MVRWPLAIILMTVGELTRRQDIILAPSAVRLWRGMVCRVVMRDENCIRRWQITLLSLAALLAEPAGHPAGAVHAAQEMEVSSVVLVVVALSLLIP